MSSKVVFQPCPCRPPLPLPSALALLIPPVSSSANSPREMQILNICTLLGLLESVIKNNTSPSHKATQNNIFTIQPYLDYYITQLLFPFLSRVVIGTKIIITFLISLKVVVYYNICINL